MVAYLPWRITAIPDVPHDPSAPAWDRAAQHGLVPLPLDHGVSSFLTISQFPPPRCTHVGCRHAAHPAAVSSGRTGRAHDDAHALFYNIILYYYIIYNIYKTCRAHDDAHRVSHTLFHNVILYYITTWMRTVWWCCEDGPAARTAHRASSSSLLYHVIILYIICYMLYIYIHTHTLTAHRAAARPAAMPAGNPHRGCAYYNAIYYIIIWYDMM